jgi:hypothetical protein
VLRDEAEHQLVKAPRRPGDRIGVAHDREAALQVAAQIGRCVAAPIGRAELA